MSDLGELSFTIRGDASQAEQSVDKTAKSVDVLRLSLTGLQKAMMVVTVINQVIRLFENLAKAVSWVSEKYKEMTGQETNAAKMERIAGGVDKLAKSYDELKRSISESNQAQKDAAALADAAAAADTRAALARIKLEEQRALLATSDPTKKADISARAKAAADDLTGTSGTAIIDRRIIENQNAQTQVLVNRNRWESERRDASFGMAMSRPMYAENDKQREGLGTAYAGYRKRYYAVEAELAALDAQEARLKREAEILKVERQAARTEAKAATLAGRQEISKGYADVGLVPDATAKTAADAALPPPRGVLTINARGGVMGGPAAVNDQARDMRAAAAEALQREQVTLLSRISGQLEE